MKLAFKRILIASLICTFARPSISWANEADDAVHASHESAQALAQQLMLNHVLSSLLGVMTNLPGYSSQEGEVGFKESFNRIKASVYSAQNQVDAHLLVPAEDQILAETRQLLSQVDDDYRHALLAFNRAHDARLGAVNAQIDYSRNLKSVAQSLASVCREGVAKSFPSGGFTNPQFAFPEFKVVVYVGQSGDKAPSGGGYSQGGTLFNKEGEAAWAAGTSYIASMFPIGTAVAAVMWAGYGLVLDQQKRSMMHEKTEMLFHYYENAAHSEDVRRYYKQACEPLVQGFDRTVSSVNAIHLRQESGELRLRAQQLGLKLQPVLDRLQKSSKTISDSQKAAIAKLPANASDDDKRAASRQAISQIEIQNLQDYMTKAMKPAVLSDLMEYIFLSAAFKIRDHQLSPILVDETETLEMLNRFSQKIYDLQRVSYRIGLLKQNPGLVAFFEKELGENKIAMQLYKRWVELFARALTATVALSMDGDVRVGAAAFHQDLLAAMKTYPQSLALQQMFEREKILQGVMK